MNFSVFASRRSAAAVWGAAALALTGVPGLSRAQESGTGTEPESAPEAEASTPSAEELEAAIRGQYAEQLNAIEWQEEGTGRIGSWATIAIPEGYRFADGAGASQLLQIWGNPPSPNELGVICNDAVDWAVFFSFEESGYVKDDEKDKLDSDKILEDKQSMQLEANKMLEEAGLEPLTVVGWAKEPFYNEETHNLEWGLILQSRSGSQTVNYNSKLLGRHGVMDAVLVCSAEEMEGLLPAYRSLLEGFNYQEGKTYADFKSGDKVAKAGLTALIVGGSAVAAAKLGLFAVVGKFFAKAWKLLVIGLVAVGALVKKLFSGRSKRLEES